MDKHSPRRTVNQTDVWEIIIGSGVLALPVAVTEEVWNLSVELSLAKRDGLNLEVAWIPRKVHTFWGSNRPRPLIRNT